MKSLCVGTGWKMNKTWAEARAYAEALRDAFPVALADVSVLVFIVPPFTVLKGVCEILAGSPVHVGAQNMHWDQAGAWTGEISPRMVRDCGADMVELGHSERRAYFGETDYTVNLKTRAALDHGLRPIICVGENAQEKAFGVAREAVVRQVKIALHDVPAAKVDQVILAYEPVWAIGVGGVPAAPEYANEVHAAMREAVAAVYSPALGDSVPILYGGSVNQENAGALLDQPEIDGLFVGRAAWDVQGFLQLVRMATTFATV